MTRQLPRVALFIDLQRFPARRLLIVLAIVNLTLTGTTALFIREYARLETHGPLAGWLIKNVLVQFHLATENVLAAWYSAMLLFAVAVLAIAAFIVDRQHRVTRRMHFGWLLFAAAFFTLSLDEIGSLHERIGMMDGLVSESARGWVYALALPIALVGAFMIGFAWLHVRRVRRTFWLLGTGVALFASNPVLEEIEMAMLGSGPGTWQMMVHDALLVIEEGLVELMGILCFATALFLYIRASTPRLLVVLPRYVLATGGALAASAIIAMFTLARVVAGMPRGDTGIVQHWFPATALLCLAGVLLIARADATSRASRMLLMACALMALCVSAAFGIGLLGYTRWWRYGDSAAAGATAFAWITAAIAARAASVTIPAREAAAGTIAIAPSDAARTPLAAGPYS